MTSHPASLKNARLGQGAPRSECEEKYKKQQEAWKELMNDLNPPGGKPVERHPTKEEALKRGFVWEHHSAAVGFAWVYHPELAQNDVKPTAAEAQLEKGESIIAKPGLVDAILADHDCQLISIVNRLNALGFQATTSGGNKPAAAAAARSLAVGDPVTGGVDGRVFYDNGGTLGEAADLTYDDVLGVTTFKDAVFLTVALPAAGGAMDGKQVIEDAGAGQFNLIYYAGGRRFRLTGAFF